ECPHVGDLACHQELQRLPAPLIFSEADQPLIHDLGPCLGGNIASQVHSQIARDLQIVCGPRVAHGVHQAHSASAGNRHQRIRFCSHSVCLHVIQVHANERAHHFQV